MKYYEIVRFANQWPDMGEYEDVDKMIRRGWFRKAISYMAEWDFGGENIDTAVSQGTLRDTVLDLQSRGDRVVYEMNGYALCESHCPSGLYDAYYLVASVDEKDLI